MRACTVGVLHTSSINERVSMHEAHCWHRSSRYDANSVYTTFCSWLWGAGSQHPVAYLGRHAVVPAPSGLSAALRIASYYVAYGTHRSINPSGTARPFRLKEDCIGVHISGNRCAQFRELQRFRNVHSDAVAHRADQVAPPSSWNCTSVDSLSKAPGLQRGRNLCAGPSAGMGT